MKACCAMYIVHGWMNESTGAGPRTRVFMWRCTSSASTLASSSSDSLSDATRPCSDAASLACAHSDCRRCSCAPSTWSKPIAASHVPKVPHRPSAAGSHTRGAAGQARRGMTSCTCTAGRHGTAGMQGTGTVMHARSACTRVHACTSSWSRLARQPPHPGRRRCLPAPRLPGP